MVEPRLGGPRAEGEGQILPGPVEEPVRPVGFLPEGVEGPRIPEIDIRPGRPFLPEDLETKRRDFVTRADALDQEIRDLAAQIPENIERIRTPPTTRGITDPLPISALRFTEPFQRLGAGLGQMLRTTFGGDTEEEIAFQDLVTGLNTKQEELFNVIWQSGVLNALPVWIEAGLVTKPEDIMEISRPGEIASSRDIEFMSDAIMRVQAQRETRKAEAEEFAEILAEGRGSLSALLSVNPGAQSSQELVNELVAAGQFQLPAGIPVESARELLLTIGFTTAEVDQRLFDSAAEAFRLSQELRAWNTRSRMLLEEGQKINSKEIVSAIRKAEWLRAVSQPAIALLRPVEWYVDRMSKPGGVTVTHFFGAEGRFLQEQGLERNRFGGYQEASPVATVDKTLDEEFREFEAIAKAQGANSWEAKRIAFDEWDGPWYQKMAVEIYGDPLTLIGFGIYPAITRKIPVLGSIVRQTEFAMNFMGEVPFRGISTVWRKTIGRTLEQRGKGLANQHTDLTRLIAEEHFDIPFEQIPPEDFRVFMEEAIDQAATNIPALDNVTAAGRALIIHQPFEAADIQELYKLLNLSEGHVPITSELVSEINRTLEMSSKYGFTSLFTPEGAADNIAGSLLGLLDDTSSGIIKGVLDNKLAAGVRVAKNTLNQETLARQFFTMSDHISAGFVAAQRSGIRTTRYQGGLVAGMLNTVDFATRVIWMDKIDRFVTQKMARAYLVFGAYAAVNIAEAGMKTIFAGLNPIWRGSPYAKLGARARGLSGTPSHLVFPTRGGYDLSLAMPVDQLDRLASVRAARRATSGNVIARNARRITDRYVMAYNDGRILRAVGQDFQTTFGYTAGVQFSNAQLANYLGEMQYKVLAQTAPDHMTAAGKLIDEVTSGFENVMPRKTAEQYRSALFDYLLTGDRRFLESFPQTFTPGRVHRAEVDKTMDKFTNVPTDIKDTVGANVETGAYWGNEEKWREIFKERVFQHYMSSPEVFRSTFADVVKAIYETPVRTQRDLNEKIELLRRSLESFDDMTHNTLAAAVTYSRSFHNANRADDVFETVWSERIIPELMTVTQGIEDAGAQLKANLGSSFFDNMTPALKDKYDVLITQMTSKAHIYRQARLRQNTIRANFFRRGKENFVSRDRRTNANFWDEFFAQTDAAWEAARIAINGEGGINQKILGTAVEINAVQFPPIVDVSARNLERIDVARMFGIHSGDLERSVYLTDIMAIQNRSNFVDAVLNQARLTAQHSNTTIEAMGWTRPRVEDVYDGIAEKMLADPRINDGVSALMTELDGMLTDIRAIGMRRNAIMNEEGMTVVQSSVDDLLERIRGKPLAPTMVNDGVEFIPQITPGTIALPSGEAQAARRNTFIRDILALDREQLEAAQTFTQNSVEAIKSLPRRNFTAASTRLARIRDRGIDIRAADAALNNFGALRDSGQSLSVREARIETWDSFIQSLDTLSIDVETTLEKRAIQLGKEHLLPGQRGAEEAIIQPPTGSPAFIQNLVDAGLPEETATKVSGVLQDLGARGKQFTRRSLARELGPGISIRGANIVDELERLGIIARTEEGVFRVSGETARSRIVQDVVREEQFPGGPMLEWQRKELRTFHAASEPPEWVLREIFDPEAVISGRPLPLGPKVTGNWQEIRQAAYDEANARRRLDFPDYDNQTAFSAMMKAIYPFWGYEAHRWAWWLPREAIRHPGVWGTWGKYIDNTDQGYVSVPGTPLDVNFARGSIFMGGMRRLQQRDYPEYYDRFEGLSEAMDYGSRWGFYPGFPVAFFMAGWGASSGEAQWGELLPATARNLLIDIPSIVAPEAWERVRQVIFPDRFRDFLIMNDVDNQEIQNPTGVYGKDLLRKRLLDEPFDDVEEAAWTKGVRGIAKWGPILEQTGVFRIRHEEKTQLYRDINEIISAETGVPVSALEDLRRFGLRYEDVFGAMHPDVRKRLKIMERYQRFAGGSKALLPSEIGRSQALVDEFWDTVEQKHIESRQKLLQVERDYLLGRQTFRQWETALVDYINGSRTIIEDLKRTSKFQDVPVTQEARLQAAEEFGIKIFFHPLQELKTLYFEKQLEDVFDEETGQVIKDFDGLFLWRDVMSQSLGPDNIGELEEFMRGDNTPLTALRFEISRKYFRPYKNIRDVVLAGFAPEEQIQIREYLAKIRLLGFRDEAEEIRGVPFQDTTLIAEYNGRVRRSRINLRVVDPELDAWLNVFEEVHSFQTAGARTRHDEIVRQLLIGNLDLLLR